MDWAIVLIIIFCSMVLLFLMGLPVAFALLLIDIIGFCIYGGIEAGPKIFILSLFASVTKFSMLPLPLFVLMGEVMFQSGIANHMLDTLDKWLGRVPGRLSLLAVGGGGLFATLSGSSMASSALLGSVLVPDMMKRGYKKEMSIGPILGSGGLAIMIPPSVLGVLLAASGQFSVGDFLIAIIIPGLLIALTYTVYIVIRCRIQPHLAPAYDLTSHVSLSEKITLTLRYVLPLGTILFLVIGLIFLGVATPTESAALGAAGCFILAFFYKSLSWKVVKVSIEQTIKVTVMMLMIFASSTAFAQILAYSGATHGLVQAVVDLPLPPIYIIIGMQIVLLVLGTFMDPVTMILITVPIYMPVIQAFGIDPLWFGTLFLLSLEIGLTSPPFGLLLFIVKGVLSNIQDLTMMDVYKAGLPFLICDLIVMILLMVFPKVVLWLPGFMR